MPDEDKPPDSGQQQIGLMLLAEDHGLTYTGKLSVYQIIPQDPPYSFLPSSEVHWRNVAVSAAVTSIRTNTNY